MPDHSPPGVPQSASASALQVRNPNALSTYVLPPAIAGEPTLPKPSQVALAPGTTVEEAERRLIQMTLEHTRDNKTRAAEILGISLKTLHNKLNKLRLRPGKS